MDGAVDEHTAVLGRVPYEEAGRVKEVAGLRANEEERADYVVFMDFGVGCAVRGVEAAGEACHYLEMGWEVCG